MFNEIWLTIDEVCSLCNEKFETVRRKCKAGVLQSTFIKEGKFSSKTWYIIPKFLFSPYNMVELVIATFISFSF